jgi:hypothetical protein
MYTHAYKCVHINMHIHIYVDMYSYMYIYVCVCVCMYVYMYTYVHIRIYTYIPVMTVIISELKNNIKSSLKVPAISFHTCRYHVSYL